MIAKQYNQGLLDSIKGESDSNVMIEQEHTKQKQIEADAAVKQAQEKTKQSLAQLALSCTDETRRNKLIDFLVGDTNTTVPARRKVVTNSPFICHLCSKYFHNKSNLNRHIATNVCTR